MMRECGDLGDIFEGDFSLRVDASGCTGMLTGCDYDIADDVWQYRDCSFDSGKIYGIVGEFKQGGTYLSYLLGGRTDFDRVKIFCNGIPVTREQLNAVGWCLEPSGEAYGKKHIRKSIEKALMQSGNKETFLSVADRFLLTEPRYDRRFKYLSGERWRAAAAYGYALGKRIFFAPYMQSNFYYQMCQCSLLRVFKNLTDCGGLVILPVGSDKLMKHIADEVLYIDREYDIYELREFYEERFNSGEWVH